MKSPFTKGKAILEGEWKEHSFRKDVFRIFEQHYRCVDTNQTFSTPDLDRLHLTQLHNQYRSRHQIPFPQEIQRIRMQVGLSAARMSEILDLGINSYRQYEQGEIPTQANAKLIRLAAQPDRLAEFVEEKAHIFTPRQLQKVRGRVDQLLRDQEKSSVMSYLWNSHLEPNEFTGFVKPELQKVAQYVLFFVERMKPLKTQLNKLLFYGDFLHFKLHGFSISGCNYRAITFGPVPSHFHELFEVLESQGYLRIEEELFSSGHIGERFLANTQAAEDKFSETEWNTMQRVAQTFEHSRSRELIDLSHEEDAWKDNHEAKSLISYQQYAFRLKGL